jgi:hypothetical protein
MLKDTLECTHGMFCKKYFHFELVENKHIHDESPIEWDDDKKSMLYAQSQGLYVSYQSQVYDWTVDLSFLIAVIFAIWTINSLLNNFKILLLRIFYHEELVCENGDTFMFADNQNKRGDKSLFN